MKSMRIYSSPNFTMVAHVKNILESRDIKCVIRNQYTSSALGEIPINECWPEVCIIDPEQIEIAKEIVKEIIEPLTDNLPPWECSKCHEILEGQFTECWNCGTEKDMKSIKANGPTSS